MNHQRRRQLVRRHIEDATTATPPTRRPGSLPGRTGAAVARAVSKGSAAGVSRFTQAAKRLLPPSVLDEVRHVRHDLVKLGHARVAVDGDRVRPRHYPPRSCSYLDDELMNREMSD
ncbi:hypothetical protein PJN90_15920 [Mycobacterium kansasii]